MELEWLLGDLAVGMLGGYSVGYAARKVFRLMCIVVGAYLASLIYLSNRKFIVVNWAEINASAENALSGIGNLSLGVSILGAGSVAGFVLGWRSG